MKEIVLLGPYREPVGNETNPWRRSIRHHLSSDFVLHDPSKDIPEDYQASDIIWTKERILGSAAVVRYYPNPSSTEDMLHMYAYMKQIPVLVFGPAAVSARCTSAGLLHHTSMFFYSLEDLVDYVRGGPSGD